ncbi:MAG TPA: hypothetical protein VFY65_15845 [Longimicrobium sp.]|nr:hypothetical protein [Longimicrobium sp.]
MRRKRAGVRRSLLLMVLRERAPVVLTVCAAVLAFGWMVPMNWDAAMERCLARYDRAHTAADTARVDRRWLGGKNPLNGYTCGVIRRDGTLDRHRRAMEARRAAREPLIEK